MSAPQTNIEKQKRRHIGPLIGIVAAAVFGVVLIVYWLFEEAAESDPPEQETVQEAPAATAPVEGETTPEGAEPTVPPTTTEPPAAP